jgi:cysteine-rich repeat protein
VTAGATTTFTIGFTNTGTEAWVGTDFRIRTANSPTTLWGTTQRSLTSGETIAPGATKTFAFGVFAPATPGIYESRWTMFRSAGAFGDVAVTTGIEVTLCGNSTIDAGETCDDGNLASGDGCSGTCVSEQRLVDLATDTADSTLFGRRDGAQLGLVGTGDITGDGVLDVVTSERQSPVGISPSRSGAGTVYALHGGAGFFSGSSTAPTGTFVQISGAEANDGLGRVGRGFLRAGDVTGDGTADLVVGSSGADGPANGRADCGEVYVFAGGAALASAGLVDLAASPAPSVLTATIVGATAGDALQVLDVADVTGDGVFDLILSAPLADSNGTDSGTVYIVQGGAAVVGTVDLASPGAVTVYTLTGAPGDQVGAVATVGNFGGSGANDLLIGAPDASPAGRTRAGKAYALFGPIASSGSFESLASVTWLGRNNNEILGSALAIGQFGGSSAADVMIGAPQWQRSAGTQAGAVLVWLGGGIASGTTFDLTSATPSAVILGADQGDTAASEIALGDMNGDGFGDLLIGAPTADGPTGARDRAGEAYVVFGRATLPASLDLASAPPNVIVYAAAAIDLLGRSGTLSLVDVDGDGRADACIGSYRGGSLREGRLDCLQAN